MAISQAIPAQSGNHEIIIPGGSSGRQQVILAAVAQPSAGSVTLQYRPVGSPVWIDAAPARTITDEQVWFVYSAVSRYRLAMTDVTGGSGLVVWVSDLDPAGFPEGSFQGLRALTVQNYTEANSKLGTQFEASFYVAALAPGASADVIFSTGALPVSIKALTLDTDASDLVINSYKNPVYTGGVAQAIYNMSDINPAATTVSIKAAPTVTSVGTQVAATTNIVGNDATSSGEGAKHSAVFASIGAERLLERNREYLRRITNNSDTAAKVAVYATWYEGELDLPLT